MIESDIKAKLSFSDGTPDIDLPIYKGTVGPDVIRDATAYIEIEFPIVNKDRIADGSVDHPQNRSAIDLNIANGAESREAVCPTDLQCSIRSINPIGKKRVSCGIGVSVGRNKPAPRIHRDSV